MRPRRIWVRHIEGRKLTSLCEKLESERAALLSTQPESLVGLPWLQHEGDVEKVHEANSLIYKLLSQ